MLVYMQCFKFYDFNKAIQSYLCQEKTRVRESSFSNLFTDRNAEKKRQTLHLALYETLISVLTKTRKTFQKNGSLLSLLKELTDDKDFANSLKVR